MSTILTGLVLIFIVSAFACLILRGAGRDTDEDR